MVIFVFWSDKDKDAFEVWHAHDDAEDNFCELDGESSRKTKDWVLVVIKITSLNLNKMIEIALLHILKIF